MSTGTSFCATFVVTTGATAPSAPRPRPPRPPPPPPGPAAEVLLPHAAVARPAARDKTSRARFTDVGSITGLSCAWRRTHIGPKYKKIRALGPRHLPRNRHLMSLGSSDWQPIDLQRVRVAGGPRRPWRFWARNG